MYLLKRMVKLEKKIQLLHNSNNPPSAVRPTNILFQPSDSRDVEYGMYRSLHGARLFGLALNIFFGHVVARAGVVVPERHRDRGGLVRRSTSEAAKDEFPDTRIPLSQSGGRREPAKGAMGENKTSVFLSVGHSLDWNFGIGEKR